MIIAAFKPGSNRAYTRRVHQFDKGQKLIVTGVALPETFEVHMSNDREGGIAYACKGSAEGVYIPDALFVSGEYVYVWLYEISDDEYGSSAGYASDLEEDTIREKEVAARTIREQNTTYEIVIPVARRAVQLPTVKIDTAGTFGYRVDENETLVPVNQ